MHLLLLPSRLSSAGGQYQPLRSNLILNIVQVLSRLASTPWFTIDRSNRKLLLFYSVVYYRYASQSNIPRIIPK